MGAILADDERHFGLRPLPAPKAHQFAQHRSVYVGIAVVALALQPNDAPNRNAGQRSDHAVVELAGVAVGLIGFGDVVFRVEFRHRFGVHPRFDARTAVTGDDESDRNIERFGQPAPEQIGYGTEQGHLVGCGTRPLAFAFVLGRLGARTAHGEEPQTLVLHGGGDFCRGAIHGLRREPAHGHLHVRLARTEPHLADQYVIEADAVLFAHFDPLRLERGFRRDDRNAPRTVVRSYDCAVVLFPRTTDDDPMSGCSGTVQGNGGLLLEHHVTAKRRMECHFGMQCGTNEREKNRKKRFRSHILNICKQKYRSDPHSE